MYRIIGGDGKEYGPISAEQLKQWLRDRRVNGQTQVRAEGDAGFRPLSSFPDLGAGVAVPPPLFEAPPSYMVYSVLVTICGCLLVGPVAIFYSMRVNDKVAKGDYEAARQASASARLWCWIALAVGVLHYVAELFFLGRITSLFQQFQQSGGM
jgi:hypothetical protein